MDPRPPQEPQAEDLKRIEFSSEKKREFEKNLTPEIKNVLFESGHAMFDPYFNKEDGSFEGYIVGAVTGVQPQLILAKPNEDGSEIEDTLNIPAVLRHVMSEEERKLRLEHLKKLHRGLYEGETIKLDIRMVDLSAWMEQLSELVAENKLRAYMNEKNFVQKAIAHIDEDSYRKKFYEDTLHAIQSNRNLKASLEARVFGRGKVDSSDPHVQETLAEFDAVLAHFAEGLHDEEERGDKFIADPELNRAASGLFVEYAMGQITDRVAFEQRIETDIIPFMSGRSFVKDGKGGLSTQSEKENRMHASNLWHWAETYKEQIAQLVADATEKYGEKDAENIKRYVKGMVKLDLNIQLSKRGRDLVNRDPYGKVEPGQQKVTKLNHAERAVSFLQTNIGWSPANKVLGAVIANPIAMGIVGAIAGRVAGRAAVTTITSAVAGTVLAPFLTPAAIVAIGTISGGTMAAMLFAKIRARKEIKQDRGMIARDRALGRTPGGPRATEMQKHIHEMESAEKIIEDLQKITGEETDPQARAAALNVLADARARLDIRLQYAKDTIRASAEEGEKSLSLGNAIDAIKRQFKRLEPKIGDEWDDPAFVTLVDDKKNKILAEIKATDETFAKFLGKESNKKVAISAAFGIAGGSLMGWLIHSDFVQDSFVGRGLNAVGRVVDDPVAATKRLSAFIFGGSAAPMPNAAAVHNGVFDFMDQPHGSKLVPFKNGSIQLPDNRFFVNDGNGNAHIVTAFGRVVSPTFHVNPDGTLMEPSGTGEWNNLFSHSEVKVPGTDYSPFLESHEFANRAVTTDFEIPKGFQIFEDPTTHTFDIQDSTGKIIEKGLEIGPDGKLTAPSAALLLKHGWNIEQSGYIPDKTEVLDRSGLTKYLRKEYGQTHAHRLDWHDNNTPMHKVGKQWVVDFEHGKPLGPFGHKPPDGDGWTVRQVSGGRWTGADGKELQLKLLGDANHRILSLKDMITQSVKGAHNLDGSIDDKFGDISAHTQAKEFAEAARHFKLRVFVGDNYTGSGESFELPVDSQGELDFANHPELRGIMFDAHGNLKVTVEAVIPESDGSGYHTLATAVRHGDGTGSVVHRSTFLRLSHPPTDTIQHVYGFNEPITEGSTSVKVDDIPFIFPTPWTPRREMEIPTLNKEDKMTARRIPQKPMGQPAFKANKELSRALVRENAFDDVMIRDAQRRRRIPNEALNESGDPAMQDALTLYALSNGIKLNKSNQKFLLDELDDSRIAEESRPLVWNKPFTFEMMKKDKNNPSGNIGMKDSLGTLVSIKDFEQRLAFAVPRPKKIYVAISESTLSKVVFDEEQVRNIFGPVIAEKLKVYGVALEFVSDADAAATRGPKPRGKGKK